MAKNEGDPLVLYAQQWVNETYGNDSRYEIIPENGRTGWTTIYALTRALQIELGIQETADNFGPTTIRKFQEQFPTGIHQQNDDDESESNVYAIIQCCLFCKGYYTGVMGVTKHFYNGTGSAIRSLKEDAGLKDTSSTVTLNIMKALLSMDYFYSYDTSEKVQNIQTIQRYLNGNYEEYIGLTPCDGIPSRSTSEALIYALQAEENLPLDVANGNFGPTTQRCLPTIPYSNVEKDYYNNVYSSEKIQKFIVLMKMGLYLNGIGTGDYSEVYDEQLIKDFQTKYALPLSMICDLTTWLSIFLSCGDTSRKATACDCATILTREKAKTLYDNGYIRVGRYLSGTTWDGTPKGLSIEELKIAQEAGLYIFPIAQGSAYTPEYFTEDSATQDLVDAVKKALELWLPTGTVIYFAVDCDPHDWQIDEYILPYFNKLNNLMTSLYFNKYQIGIYGTRNVCSRISEQNLAVNSFVSDMSSGYSGNLGFPLPDNWAFDQFATVTVGSGIGEIEIDKDAASGRDLGLNNSMIFTDNGKVYYSLVDMFNLALNYTNNDIEKSNLLVLQYIRKKRYGDSDIFAGNILENIKWDIVAGEIDKNYCDLVDKQLFNLTFDFEDLANPTTFHDFPHLAATLNALLYKTGNEDWKSFDEILDCYAGWAGDTISFANTIKENEGNPDFSANDAICSVGAEKFNLQDYIDDIDAYNLYYMIKNKGFTLPEAFYFYYVLPSLETHIYDYEKRATKFLEYMTTAHFNSLCVSINLEEFPIGFLKHLLCDAEQKYIDRAIAAFRIFLFQQYNEGR